MRTLKIHHIRALMGVAVKGRQPLQGAELLIRTVGTVGCPVVIRLEVEVLVLPVCKVLPQVNHSGGLADLGKNIIQHRVFIHHRGPRGQLLRVDDAGGRCQQEGNLARVVGGKITDRLHVFVQLLLGGILHRKELCEHPAVLAQQDTAFLHLAEQHLIHSALGVDRRIAEGELVLHPAGKATLPAAVQQRLHTERRELGSLAVFQLQLAALGPQDIHQREAEQQHRAEEQQRIARTALAAIFAVHDLFFHTSTPPLRNWHTVPLRWWLPPHSRQRLLLCQRILSVLLRYYG